MNLRLTLLGALAVGLVSTAAYAAAPDSTAPGSATGSSPPTAQPADPNDTGTMPNQTGMPAGTGAPADTMPPAPTAADTSAPPAATGAAVNTSSTTDPTTGAVHTTVATAPVPDTPENRRLYGGPMSHAGRHSHAQGN